MKYSLNKVLKRIIKAIRHLVDAYFLYPYKVFLLWLNSVEYAKMPILRGFPVINNSGKILLGKNVIITAKMRNNLVGGKTTTAIGVGKNATLTIGNNVGISNAVIFAMTKITIEDDVFVGGGVQIYDADFHSIKYAQRMEQPDKNIKTAPVTIRKGAFLGTSSIIMKGVEIGARSVIAAGAVVVKSVPPDEIWGGNPAKFIKKIENDLS